MRFQPAVSEMHRRRVVCAAAWLLALPLIAAAQTQPVEISFTVAMPLPHLFEVDVAVKRTTNGPQEERLVMPVWTPGSYLVREFARHVQDFAATAAGQPLQWEKINKDTWRVVTNGARE